MKKARKYVLRFLIAVVVMALILFVAAQTTWVRSWIKGAIASAVSEGTNGDLTIREFGGTLFGHVSLEGVLLRVDGDTLASIARIDVRFSVLGLVYKSAIIEDLHIEDFHVRIVKNPDGVWNIARIVKSGRSEQKREEAVGPFPWLIRADRIELSGGSVTVGSRDSAGGRAMIVRDFGLVGSMIYSEQEKAILVDSLGFLMSNPDLELKHLTAEAEITDGALILHQATIVTRANVINLAGQYALKDGVPSRAVISTGPMELSEVPNLPPGLNRGLHPEIRGSAELTNDDLTLDLTVLSKREQVRVTGNIASISREVRSSIRADLVGINLGGWFPQALPSTNLTGVLEVQGSGFRSDGLDAELVASLGHSQIYERAVDSLNARVRLRRHAVQGDVALRGNFGSGRIKVAISDIRSLAGYEIDLEAENLDLSVPLRNEGLMSKLWVQAHLQGSGTDLSEADVEMHILARGTVGDGIEIDSLAALAEIEGGRILVREFALVNPAVVADARGVFGLDKTLSAEGTLHIVDPARLAILAGLDTSIAGAGVLEVIIDGNLDSLVSRIDYALENVQFDLVRADSLMGTAKLALVHGDLEMSGRVQGAGLHVDGVEAQSAEAEGLVRTGMIEASGSLVLAEDLSVTVGGTIRLGDTVHVELPLLRLEVGDDRWEKETDPVVATIAGSRVELQGFTIKSGAQSILVQGVYDSEDSVDIRVRIDSTKIGPVSEYAGLAVPLSGRLTLDLFVNGPVQSPLIKADLEARRIVLAAQDMGDLTLSSLASDSGIVWELTVVDPIGNEVASSGRVPYVIGARGISVTEDSALTGQFLTTGYDLKWASSVREEFKNVAGSLTARLDLSGTLSRPVLNGTITLDGGALFVPSIGLDLRDLVLAGRVDGDRLHLDSLRVRVGDGTLKAWGSATLPLGSSLSTADSIELVVKGEQITLNSPRKYELQVNADLRASFTGSELDYAGTITVPQSRLFLQGIFTSLTPTRRSTDRPMLVQATVPFDSLAASRADTTERKRGGAPVFGKRTRGRVALALPRNTWIQSPNINVELYGDLTAIQTDTLLELEGTLRISRGTVQLIGKRFAVREGKAEFTRGPRINPIFSVELEYRFRDANRQDRALMARLTGTVETPNMTFALDEKPVTQQDAISYLIFGRSADELTLNQQSSMSGGNENVAGAMAFDMLGAQLSNLIAQRVGLDVVEIKSTDGTKAGTLVAGKYIAEGIFISYEKGFGEYGANETIPEVFTIEYELIRSLFLQFVQANDRRSGADIILKIE